MTATLQARADRLAPFFDGDWYLSRYADVAASGMDPFQHYVDHGAAEGRDPHPLFDVRWYLSEYPNVAAAGIGALEHYIDHGAAEGRDPHPRFETAWYLSRHPEAGAPGENPLRHYIARHGSSSRYLGQNIAAKIAALRADESRWPPAITPVEEAGIVISACGRLFKPLYANLRNIRALGCELPIEVWHLPGEFTGRQIAFLGDVANFVEARDTPFDALSGRHEVHGFKAWMLSQSRFKKTLMLDVNSFPVRNPEIVFQSGHDCVLWRDDPRCLLLDRIAELRGVMGIAVHSHEFESGQLFVDKEAAGMRDALRFAAALNTLGKRLYTYTWGDKETYALAFDILGREYSIAPPAIIHYQQEDKSERGGLGQPWLDGEELFYHPMADREVWWRRKEGWSILEEEAAKAEKQCA